MITTYIIPPVRDSIVCDQRNSYREGGGLEKAGVAAFRIDDSCDFSHLMFAWEYTILQFFNQRIENIIFVKIQNLQTHVIISN